jgi:hypothetical protein
MPIGPFRFWLCLRDLPQLLLKRSLVIVALKAARDGGEVIRLLG